MASKTFTEGRHTGEHIVSEANGARAREQGVLASGNHPAGTVLALNGDGRYVPVNFGAENGTEDAKAVLYANTDASQAPQPCVVHTRACEVHGEALIWPTNATEEQIESGINALILRGVIVR